MIEYSSLLFLDQVGTGAEQCMAALMSNEPEKWTLS